MLLYVAAIIIAIAEAVVVPRGLPFPYLEGCGKALPNGQSSGSVSNVTMASDGHQRNYLIFIPPKYHSVIPTPAILSYHGGVRTAENQLLLDELTSPEFNTGSIVIYPQGINVRITHMI
jgi:poly(3-hydroxybutyrate) depolymerase